MSRLDLVLWLTGYSINTALAVVLARQRRFRQHPWFCAWIFTCVVSNTILLVANRFASPTFYSGTFRVFEGLDCLLQVSVLFEFARLSLVDGKGWLPYLRLQLALGCFAAGSLAAFLASSAEMAGSSFVEAYWSRADLLITVFICLMSVIILGLSYANGLINTKLDQSRFYGFVGWALLSLATDTSHVYWRTARFFGFLELLNALGVQLILLFWFTIYVRTADVTVWSSFREWLYLRLPRGLV